MPRDGRGLRIGLVVPQSGAARHDGPVRGRRRPAGRARAQRRRRRPRCVRRPGARRRRGAGRTSSRGRSPGSATPATSTPWSASTPATCTARSSARSRAGRRTSSRRRTREAAARPGVVCIGADPARSSAPRCVAGPRARPAPVGARRQRLHLAAGGAPRSARPLVAAAGGAGGARRAGCPSGASRPALDRLTDGLCRSGADAVLLSLVGRDLVTFNRALRHADLDRRLVRLSGALEENGLLAGRRRADRHALRGDVVVRVDDRRAAPPPGRAARHAARAAGPGADTYAEGVYDGLHLVARLAAAGTLHPEGLASGRRPGARR